MTPADEILAWYDAHRRDLPWRRDADPYRVWLSEVMLQQTRVDVVIPYYHRFLERYPTVEALAAADLDEVLARWSGLGYYRRARQLHAAARKVAAEGFPRTAEGWKKLPGVGDYTAAAVASIAFGVEVPVLDGNVERVLCRVHGIAEDPKRAAVRRRLLGHAARLLDRGRPGDSNQALMELGATICTPKGPECAACPLEVWCVARREGAQAEYPVARKRRAPVRVRRIAVAVEEGGRRLLFRRPEDEELLAGTWELPWAENGSKGEGEPRRLAAALAGRYGGQWRVGEPVATVRHSITHRAFEVEVRRGELVRAPDGDWEAGWFPEREIEALATSSLVPKVLRAVRSGDVGDGGAAG